MRNHGYRVTGTITVEVRVDTLTTDLDTEFVINEVMNDLARSVGNDGIAFVHDDLNFEPYELDGPEYD